MLTAADTVLASEVEAPAVLSQGDQPHLLAWREWTEPAEVAQQSGSFEDCNVLDQLDGLTNIDVRFAQSTMFIEPTRALGRRRRKYRSRHLTRIGSQSEPLGSQRAGEAT
jgi:hypothetical protein